VSNQSIPEIKSIAMFDTSVVTDNLGDFIIMDAARGVLRDLFPFGQMVSVPTHDYLGPVGRRVVQEADFAFVGGTNLLTAKFLWYRQWKLSVLDVFRIGKPILLGVGWHKYQHWIDPVTAFFLRNILCGDVLHSVRDSYTEKKLKDAGVSNVINTSCVSMWGLTPEHCAAIPTERQKSVVITLTAYLANPEVDRAWIREVASHYDKVWFWPQMRSDMEYAQSVIDSPFSVVAPHLSSYDELLRSEAIDFIGTRLHGGIRALQNKRRSLIIAVDNRAAEISRDTNLPVIARDNSDALRDWIVSGAPTAITLPWDNIARWKASLGISRVAGAPAESLV